MKRLLSIMTGVGLSLLGLVGVLVSILAIIDPVGTKMADDGDPFGTLPTTVESSVLLMAYLLITSFGAWLSWRGGRRSDPTGAVR